MATPTAPHFRIAYRQSLGSGEEMVTTVRLAQGTPNPTGPLSASAAQVAAAAAPHFDTWRTAVASRRIAQWQPLDLTVYRISGTGLADDQATAVVNTGAGTGTGAALPLETSLVISLLTGAPGARRRGRTYLGGFLASMMSSVSTERGRFQASSVTAELTAFEGLLTGLRGLSQSVPGALLPVVVSGATTPPSAFTITQVRCDDVPDVQRRRTKDQKGNVTTRNVPF
jgi:hypothetical protein